MQKLGIWLAIFGVGSVVLNQFGYEFKILSWIEVWGPTTAWLIRGGLVAAGGLLWFLGRPKATPQNETAQRATG